MVVRSNVRRSKFAQWRLQGSAANLVLAIEPRGESRKLTHGPAATLFLICLALLRDDRCNSDPESPEIGAEVPAVLLQKLTTTTQLAVQKLVRQFYRLPSEDRKTGAISADLTDQLCIQAEGWELTVIVQGFSGQTKEDVTGADMGIVIDLKNGERQVSKAMFFQAKVDSENLVDVASLPRLKTQIPKMLSHTRESYVIAYSPTDVSVYHGSSTNKKLTLEQVLADAVGCKRGDRDRLVLAEALEKDISIEARFQKLNRPAPVQQNFLF